MQDVYLWRSGQRDLRQSGVVTNLRRSRNGFSFDFANILAIRLDCQRLHVTGVDGGNWTACIYLALARTTGEEKLRKHVEGDAAEIIQLYRRDHSVCSSLRQRLRSFEG